MRERGEGERGGREGGRGDRGEGEIKELMINSTRIIPPDIM